MTAEEFDTALLQTKARSPNVFRQMEGHCQGHGTFLTGLELTETATDTGSFSEFRFYSHASLRNGQEDHLHGLWLNEEMQAIFHECPCMAVKLLDRNAPHAAPDGDEGYVVSIALDNACLGQTDALVLGNALNAFADCLAAMRADPPRVAESLFRFNNDHADAVGEYARARRERRPHAKPSRRQTMADTIEIVRGLLESNLQVILTGAPGTGKTYTAKKVAFAMTGDTEDTPKEALHIASVQFHPGYDYSDFVIGMKPVLVDKQGNETSTGTELQVSYRWKDGVFKKFADKARKAFDESKYKRNAPKFVFLIDEINRADLSRVFGELFSLLEEEYRYPNNDKGVILPNGKDFVIPKNLYIIGTMNDIDRSVESMDFALRRRFAWYEVTASSSEYIIGKMVPNTVYSQNLTKAMKALNREIGGEEGATLDLRLGSEYQLGGAIFAKFEKCGGSFSTLWDRFIRTTLNEYLRGRKDKNHLLEQLKGVFDNAVKAAPQKADA